MSRNVLKLSSFILICIILNFAFISAQSSTEHLGNTITKSDFNFGHQSGYMYSRMDDAYFKDGGNWEFQTGFLSYYTSNMPMVQNPYWKKRLMLTIPLYLKIYASNAIELAFEVTDLFVEFPYQNVHNMGGKTPRFKTKMRLLKEHKYFPAIALTLGVAFSSAKPFTIWDDKHNYYESNGLAGAGTGVADYLIQFTFSKTIDSTITISSHIGLAPLGSPVEYQRGSGQADEIPYGISVRKEFSPQWAAQAEIAGMYNGLRSTRLAHYSVLRVQGHWLTNKTKLTLNLERGLTRESDEWVFGAYSTFYFKLRFKK